MSDWCTIESDPGVFTALIEEIGVKGVTVEELYDVDQPMETQVYGLIFLFKYIPEQRNCLKDYDSDLFFANQVITNACATQALINILMNQSDLEIGEELGNFKSFTKGMDSKTKGLVIGNSEKIRTVHNSFKKVEPFIFDQKDHGGKTEDAFHFVAYISHKNQIYELDGLQPGPILLGETDPSQDWLSLVGTEIKQRIQKYSQSEIRFNLMAVVESQKLKAQKYLKSLNQEKWSILNKMIKLNVDMIPYESDFQSLSELSLPVLELSFGDKESCEARLKQINLEQMKQNQIITNEQLKEKQQAKENIRRKHDYTPFIIELLKKCAEKGDLENLIQQAQK